MEFITKFLEAMQALKLILLALSLIVGGILLVVSFYRRDLRLASLGIVVGSAQFILPMLGNVLHGHTATQRKAEVQAFNHARLPQNYPRQLVLHGDLQGGGVAVLMILGYFDQVAILDKPPFTSSWYPRADRSEKCRNAVAVIQRNDVSGWITTNSSDSDRVKANKVISGCVPQSKEIFAINPAHVVVRVDRDVTMRANDRRDAPDAIQMDLYDKGRERLVWYDEMPVLQPSNSAFDLIGDSGKYPCYGFDDTQIIENIIDSARFTDKAKSMMGRPGR